MSVKILLLIGKGVSGKIIQAYLIENYTLVASIIEDPPSRTKMLERRINKLGIYKVIMQLLFMKIIIPFLRLMFRRRYEELIGGFDLKKANDNNTNVFNVLSINDDKTQELVTRIDHDIIVVCGTRIIGKKLLSALQKPILNIHVGITPEYRGVHGGYWALAKGDVENFGVTIHYVDSGIDTGRVVSQKRIFPTNRDCFITYPLLQLQAAKECLGAAISKIIEGDSSVIDTEGRNSKLYYHPTIGFYLWNWLKRGIK